MAGEDRLIIRRSEGEGDGRVVALRGGAEVGYYWMEGEPPEGTVRIGAEEAAVAERLREHALEGARRAGYRRVRMGGEVVAVPEPHVEGDELERRTRRDFFVGGRLKEVPAAPARRMVVLRWLASRFEPGVRYAEAEVNERLLRHHPDFAALRRYMADAGLLEREAGVYWRAGAPRQG